MKTTNRIPETLSVKLARFGRRYPKLVLIVSILSTIVSVVAFTSLVPFLNNVVGLACALFSMLGYAGEVMILIARRTQSALKPSAPITYLPVNPGRDSNPGFRYVQPRRKVEANGTTTTDREDLKRFVEFSAVSPDIAGSHPDLDVEKRFKLYERWFGLNPDSFLSLERREPKGRWIPIAVSIILPLTQTGAALFMTGQRTVLQLSTGDISPPNFPFDALLIDTLIVTDRYRGSTRGYGFPGLLLRHLAVFWEGSETQILVEPDSRKVESLVRKKLLLKQIENREAEEKLFQLHYPAGVAPGPHRTLVDKLIANINTSRKWPLYPSP